MMKLSGDSLFRLVACNQRRKCCVDPIIRSQIIVANDNHEVSSLLVCYGIGIRWFPSVSGKVQHSDK